MLSHGTRVDPGGARQADAALCQVVARELVGASADRLDKAQPARVLQQAVAPQPGDHQHIRLANPRGQRLGVAYLEASDPGTL